MQEIRKQEEESKQRPYRTEVVTVTVQLYTSSPLAI